MRARLATLWDAARSSYWFVPTVMTAGGIALSFATVATDDAVNVDFTAGPLLYSGGPEGARALLLAIAGSMITVTGVAFSVTIVALSLATSQFGSRLLRSFLRDAPNQMVLGVLISTFAYCLLVLRTVRGPGPDEFVPHLAVNVSIVLALASVVALIFFIHRVASSIQAEVIIGTVARELDATIERLLPPEPQGSESGADHGGFPERFDEEASPIASDASGYVQTIDGPGLVSLAVERDLVLRVERRPGKFAVAGSAICSVWPGDSADDDLAHEVNRRFILGATRTPAQDIEFAIDQLTEIAVRSLSPGINNPFTAIICLDKLGAALSLIAERPGRASLHYDQDRRLRLKTPTAQFRDIVDTAFNQVRQYGASSAAVSIRLLETIAVVMKRARGRERREALWRHAEMILRASDEQLPEEQDREDLHDRFETIREL